MDGIYSVQEADNKMTFYPTNSDWKLGKKAVKWRDEGLWGEVLPRHLARQIPSLVREVLGKKLSESFNESQVATIIALNFLATDLKKALYDKNEQHLIETGREMRSTQLKQAVLEIIMNHQDLLAKGKKTAINSRLKY